MPPMRRGALPVYLRERFGLPASIENDGVCAANGEVRFGRWRQFARYTVVTVGTCVGGVLVIDGKLILGRGGLPPEFGAISLDPSIPDPYGPVPGRLDVLGSASGMVRRYEALNAEGATGDGARGIGALAEQGEAAAMQAVEETARWLAQAFGIITNVVNLDAIVVGGGIAASSFFLGRLRRHMTDFVWPPAYRTPEIVPAVHGNNAGLLGAAAFAMDEHHTPEHASR